MENTDRNTENDWQNAQYSAPAHETQANSHNDDLRSAEANGYGTEDTDDRHRYAVQNNPDPDDEEEDDQEDDDFAGDWGHVDPAEGNSPFPDPNDPSGPGSAV